MDLYNIICPYCQAVHHPRDYEEGYQAVLCMECNKPFVNQTTMTPVFVSFALVGVEPNGPILPTPEELEFVESLADRIENEETRKIHSSGRVVNEEART